MPTLATDTVQFHLQSPYIYFEHYFAAHDSAGSLGGGASGSLLSGGMGGVGQPSETWADSERERSRKEKKHKNKDKDKDATESDKEKKKRKKEKKRKKNKDDKD